MFFVRYYLGLIIFFFFVDNPSKASIDQKFGREQSGNVNKRVAVLCTETSMRCARSCSMYLQCSSSILEGLTNMPSSVPDLPQQPPVMNTPMIPTTPARQVCKDGIASVPAEALTGPLNQVISQLCTEMSTVCARSCQTYIDQCSSPNNSPLLPSLPMEDQPQPSVTAVPIITGRPPSTADQAPPDNGCSGQGKSCVDHRDCCPYLYCKRFIHGTGAEAKLGSCAPDPERIR